MIEDEEEREFEEAQVDAAKEDQFGMSMQARAGA